MKVYVVIFTCLSSITLFGQAEKAEFENSHNWSVLTGLIQPVLLKGFNVAGTYFSNKWTFEYSHGMFLDYPEFVRKDKGLTYLKSLYSTGPGVGYRFKKNLDLRFEVKVHQYDAGLNDSESIQYTNLDCGFGLYSRRYLFRRKENALQNLFIEHSFRYWQNIFSTLPNGQVEYVDNEGRNRTHTPHNIGFFYNLSVGYTFKKDSDRIK